MLYHHEPREVILSQHTEFRLIRAQNRLQLVKESFQYVPILETLKALLNQPDVLAEVYQPVSHVLIVLLQYILTPIDYLLLHFFMSGKFTGTHVE